MAASGSTGPLREGSLSDGAAPSLRRSAVVVAALSAAGLSYELALARLSAYVLSHHLAHFVVGVALAGLGLGGALASLRARRGLSAGAPSLGALFAVATFALPFLGAGPRGTVVLALVVALGFFVSVGFAAGRAYEAARARVSRAYLADALGGLVGAVVALSTLSLRGPQGALGVTCLASALAALAAARSRRVRFLAASTCAAALAAVGALPQSAIGPVEGTPMRARLHAAGEKRGAAVESRWDAHGRADLVVVPGLGVEEIYVDGAAPALLVRDAARPEVAEAHARDLPFFPYGLRRPKDVLALGAGAGYDAWLALASGARHVEHVELSGAVLALARPRSGTSADVLRDPRVRVREGDARRALEGRSRRFDLIVMALLQGQADGRASLAMREARLYTVEAARACVEGLREDGRLAVFFHERAHLRRYRETLREVLGPRGHLVAFSHRASAPYRFVLYGGVAPFDARERDGLAAIRAAGRFREVREETAPGAALPPTRDARPFFFDLEGGAPAGALAWCGLTALLAAAFAFARRGGKGLGRGRVVALASGVGLAGAELFILEQASASCGDAVVALGVVLPALLAGIALGAWAFARSSSGARAASSATVALAVAGLALFVSPGALLAVAEWMALGTWALCGVALGALHAALFPAALADARDEPGEIAWRTALSSLAFLASSAAFPVLWMSGSLAIAPLPAVAFYVLGALAVRRIDAPG